MPNPAKSAWFLLWIQELVGYSRNLVYLVALLAAFFLALPYTRWGGRDGDGAERSRRIVAAAALAVFTSIVILTVIAYFFRGRDWALSAGR